MSFKEYAKIFLFIIVPIIASTVILFLPISLIRIVWLKISCSIVFMFLWLFVILKFIEKIEGDYRGRKK